MKRDRLIILAREIGRWRKLLLLLIGICCPNRSASEASARPTQDAPKSQDCPTPRAAGRSGEVAGRILFLLQSIVDCLKFHGAGEQPMRPNKEVESSRLEK